MDTGASVLTIITNAAASSVWIVVSSVLAVAVPVAAVVTGRVLLEPFVDFPRFARIAVPSESADDGDDGEGHADAGIVCEKALGGCARRWIGKYDGRGAASVLEEVEPGAGATEGCCAPQLVGI